MSETRKTIPVSQLQRAALNSAQTSPAAAATSSVITGQISTALKKGPTGGGGSNLGEQSTPRAVRKQANPVKQTVLATSSIAAKISTPLSANMGPRPSKYINPPPPPLIPTVPAVTHAVTATKQIQTNNSNTVGRNVFQLSTTVSPKTNTATATNGTTTIHGPQKPKGETTTTITTTTLKKPTTTTTITATVKPEIDSPLTQTASSESSSDDSSSDSSGSSDESEVEEIQKKKDPDFATSVTPVIDSEIPGPSSGTAKRGRGRPRLSVVTPRPAKQPKLGNQRAKSTPRKKSERVPKPPVIFSPDTARGVRPGVKRRGRGCGGCPGCRREDCGKCNYCKDKTKFGGPGKKKQRCSMRTCLNFVKPLHGKGQPVTSTAAPSTPPSSDINVIPVSKLASSLKVAEVIEQLRQNLSANIPPVIDRESIPTIFPSLTSAAMSKATTSLIISKPEQFHTTTSPAITSIAETKIVGPVASSSSLLQIQTTKSSPDVTKSPAKSQVKSQATGGPPPVVTKATPSKTTPSKTTPSKTTPSKAPPTIISKAPPISQGVDPSIYPVTRSAVPKPPEPIKQPETKTVTTPQLSAQLKTSEVQKKLVEAEEKEQTDAVEEKTKETIQKDVGNKLSNIAMRTRRQLQDVHEKIKCAMCGRERKPSLMRSAKFCTQRCIEAWNEKKLQSGSSKSTGITTEGSKSGGGTPTQQRKLPRALKNLQIDMAWDRTGSPGTRPPPSFTPTVAASPKPTMTSTPTHTATTATNKRPTSSTGVQPTPPSRKVNKDIDVNVGSKRPSQQPPPPPQKKMKEAEPAKSVSFNLTAIPTSTVEPISAPPLSRTVPPPSISIVPLDQLTALGTALLSQQQQRAAVTSATTISSSSFISSPYSTGIARGNRGIPDGLPLDVRTWTIAQVVDFFQSTSDCKDYAAVFREQEVDGTALLLLKQESLVKCLGIKLGRALKIMVHVEELQKLYA